MAVELYIYSTVDPTTSNNDSANAASPGDAANIVKGKIWVNTTASPVRQFVCRSSSGSAVWQRMASNDVASSSLTGLMSNTDKVDHDAVVAGFKGGRAISAADTTVLADAGKIIDDTATTTHALTVPPNSSVAYPLYSVLTWCCRGVAAVPTITAGGGVTLLAPQGQTLVVSTPTSTKHSLVQAVKLATDTWAVSGNLVAG